MAEKPAFYNNWKDGSISSGSTMSSVNDDPYAGFKGSSLGPTVQDPISIALFNSTPERLRQIATLLKNAGYRVPVTGKYSNALANAYATATQEALNQQSRLGLPITVESYLLQEERPGKEGSNKPSIREDIQIWNPTKTAGVVQDLSVKLLGREATAEEVSYISSKLNTAQKNAATRTQYVNKAGKLTTTVTGGLDEDQFIIDIFQKDKRFAPEIAAIKQRKETKEASGLELTRQDLIRTGLANGVNLNADQIASFEQRMKSGEDIDAIRNTIRETASLGMPDPVKRLVASGVDLSTVYSPYKSLLAQTLEINPNSISLDDPTLRMAIGPDKEMSLYEYQKALRKDPRWQYTNQAREQASSIATTVLRDFGFMG